MCGMQKTTVYLPDDLKSALERMAGETGRSEAELIREGIRQVVAKRPAPAPTVGTFASGVPDLAERVDELLAAGFGW